MFKQIFRYVNIQDLQIATPSKNLYESKIWGPCELLFRSFEFSCVFDCRKASISKIHTTDNGLADFYGLVEWTGSRLNFYWIYAPLETILVYIISHVRKLIVGKLELCV